MSRHVFACGDRVRSRSGVVSRVLGVAESGRVLLASEATGRSRMAHPSSLRLVERFAPNQSGMGAE